MFEDEIMHLLENDPEIEKVVVVKNNDCDGIRKKMLEAGIPHKVHPVEELSEKKEEKSLTLNIYMLELALHAIPENLKKLYIQKWKQCLRIRMEFCFLWALRKCTRGN